jgi:ADP-ribose pyrophosphatase YjhB (NUDIX family)
MDNPKPILGVDIASIKGGKFLPINCKDIKVWCLPGGEVEAEETLTQAGIREARKVDVY